MIAFDCCITMATLICKRKIFEVYRISQSNVTFYELLKHKCLFYRYPLLASLVALTHRWVNAIYVNLK